MKLYKEEILKLNRIKRINLINSVTGIKPANLIGTKSKEGYENLAIISSVVHLGSDPAILGFALRPQKYQKSDTYKNIINTSFFSINSISNEFIENAHYTSAKLPFGQSEFEKMKIKKEYIEDFYSPFVYSSSIKIGLKLNKEISLPNECVLITGNICVISIDDKILTETGHINLMDSNIVGISGVDTYYSLVKSKKMPYIGTKDIDKLF